MLNLCATLDAQSSTDPENLGDAVWWFALYLKCPEVFSNGCLSDPDNYFSKPAKHFRRGDICGIGLDGGDGDGANGDSSDEAATDGIVLNHEDKASAALVFGDICRKVELGAHAESNCDGAAAEDSAGGPKDGWHHTPTRQLFKECCEAIKHCNAELTQAAQDHKFRFQTQKMFHSYGKDVEDADKWDYYSDNDDVLLWVKDKYVMANIEEIIEMRQAPSDRTSQ